MIFTTTAVFAVMASLAEAHVTLFHSSMYGLYGDKPQPEQPEGGDFANNLPVNPLRQDHNLSEDQWFAHGRKAFPPPKGVFMELESGGSFVGELSCDRANTTMGYPEELPEYNKNMLYACGVPNGEQNPLHNSQKADEPIDLKFFGGTALAIAYTSDINALKPTDLTVISVNYTSPWFRETVYQIPAGLPPCPPDGCLCSWNWIHKSEFGEGYGPEIYNNVYACNVTGNTNPNNQVVLGGGQVPKRCDANPDECVKGPKQPMYVFMASGNNMDPPGDASNPFYKQEYGFADGAQNDLFPDAAPQVGHLMADAKPEVKPEVKICKNAAQL